MSFDSSAKAQLIHLATENIKTFPILEKYLEEINNLHCNKFSSSSEQTTKSIAKIYRQRILLRERKGLDRGATLSTYEAIKSHKGASVKGHVVSLASTPGFLLFITDPSISCLIDVSFHMGEDGGQFGHLSD